MLKNKSAALPLLFVVGLALLAAGCDKQPRATQAASDDASFAIGLKKAQADSLWQAMIASNDKKIANTNYFLQMAGNYLSDTTQLAAIRAENNLLPSKRYNQQNLRDIIDRYDSAENRVLQGIGELYNANPKIQIVNTSQALEEIKAADDSVLIFRYMYDKIVDEYNLALTQNKKAAKDQDLKPLPLFRLNP